MKHKKTEKGSVVRQVFSNEMKCLDNWMYCKTILLHYVMLNISLEMSQYTYIYCIFFWQTILAVQMWFLYLSSSRSTSRRSLAQLFSSGFPQILDHQNQVAEVLDPSEPVNFDLRREEADHLLANTLILQFLAFTRYFWMPGHLSCAVLFYLCALKSVRLHLLIQKRVNWNSLLLVENIVTVFLISCNLFKL